jgi:cytochrome c biogenesis protein CcmG/thiol:disulfide interchange protein DsbE
MHTNPSQRFKLVSFIALTLGICWIGISTTLPSGVPEKGIQAPQEGFRAPDFTLETMDGSTITLSALRGQAVLVNLWASWCGPCQSEMPAMQRIYEEYRDDGFTILAINTTYQDNPADIAAFVQNHDITFPILLDRDRTVSELYQLFALPSSFFVDRNGVIQEAIFGGPMAEALLRTRVENLLKGNP